MGGGGGEEVVEHCHSIMHKFDYTNFQIFFGGGGREIEAGGTIPAPPPLYETLILCACTQSI